MSKNEKETPEVVPLTSEQLIVVSRILEEIAKLNLQNTVPPEVEIGWSNPPTSAW